MSASDDRLRVLHLIVSLGPTNTEYNEHCLPMAHERDITVCSFSEAGVAIPDEITAFSGDGTYRGFWRTLRSALGEGSYDIIHVHAPRTAILLMLMMLRLHTRMSNAVCTVHNSFANFRPLGRVLLFPVFAWFPAVVVCSRSAYASLPPAVRRLGGRRVAIVQNGVDIDRVRGVVGSTTHSGRRGFTVVWVGRLLSRKDPESAVDAFARMSAESDRLVIIGDGERAPALLQHIDARGLGSRVSVTGLVGREDVYRSLAESDVYLSTSHGEGLPIAVLEAMACGIPAVLSDIPPHREIAEAVGQVPLVPPGDVDGFAAALLRLREMTPEERTGIGVQGRRAVEERFSLSAMHRGYGRVYEGLLDRTISDRRLRMKG